MRTIVLYCILLLFTQNAIAQKLHMFRTIYYPANPYGGVEELEEFINQELVYPEEAIKNEIEGDVFITFKVNSKGSVIYKEVIEAGNPLLRAETERIFDKIMWEEDASRSDKDLGFEKMKLSFDLKKYKKVVKKRGYRSLPYQDYPIDSSAKVYNINQVDVQPQIKNASSVNNFVNENFSYPSVAMQRGISGRVTLDFVIEPYGRVSNVRIVEPVGGGCSQEAVRLAKAMRWTPGLKKGRAVRTIYRYQLNFVHPGGSVH